MYSFCVFLTEKGCIPSYYIPSVLSIFRSPTRNKGTRFLKQRRRGGETQRFFGGIPVSGGNGTGGIIVGTLFCLRGRHFGCPLTNTSGRARITPVQPATPEITELLLASVV